MKTLLTALAILIALLLALNLQAQKIRVPVEGEQWIELPETGAGTSTNITIIQITTNVFTTVTIITNISITQVIGASGTTPIVILKDNVINPDLGTRLMRNFSVPTTFVLGSFKTNNFTTFYWRNPNRQRITWPPGIIWTGPIPTNQVRGAVLLEYVASDLAVWATP